MRIDAVNGSDAAHVALQPGPTSPTPTPPGGAIYGQGRPERRGPPFEGTPVVKPYLYCAGRNPIHALTRAPLSTARQATRCL
ncbi:hypothetical protein AAFF_G00107810 [Aldrovandia affinis]|uniref:Uncharacterized protein n=1 Tax=Aldrovandia affinis TaxID=143900 RepID=A0AAD7WAX2_9TELE|nr:hypothetical protein AAFF_G00107810 [Aldrovandia affinis]